MIATHDGLRVIVLGDHLLADFIPTWLEALMPWHRTIGIVSAILTFPVLAWSGNQFFVGAWNGLRNHNTNMDTLVALGTGAAWAYSAVVVFAPGLFPAGTRGMYFEVAVIVIALILLGQALEMRAKSRSSAAIKKLLELQAKTARVIRGGKEIDVPIEDVVVGDTVLVRPGEKVPVDGVILQGESAIDESVVTGESVPVDKEPGDVVIGSSVNKTGAFTFRATKVGEDTALARIVEMVQQAQNSKPPIGRLVDLISSYFVPTVMIIGILTFLVVQLRPSARAELCHRHDGLSARHRLSLRPRSRHADQLNGRRGQGSRAWRPDPQRRGSGDGLAPDDHRAG